MTPSLRYKHLQTICPNMATVRGKQKKQKTGFVMILKKHCGLNWYTSYMLYDPDKLIPCFWQINSNYTVYSIYSRRYRVSYNSKDHKCFSAVLPPVFLIHCHTGGCWVRVWESCKGNVQIKTTHSKWGLFVLIKNHKLTCRIRLHCCVFFSMSWFCATPLGLHWTRNTLTSVSSYSKERNINLVMPLNLHFLVNTPLK